MRVTLGLTALMIFWSFLTVVTPAYAGTEVTEFEEPDVNRAFCGKQIPFSFCRCAFQNQGCEVMGISQTEARSTVDGKFKKWVGEQIEIVAKSCIDGGGHWNTPTRQCITCTDGDVYYKNKCVSPDKAGDDAPAPVCVSQLDFSKDWKKFSDFSKPQDSGELSDQTKKYYNKLNELGDKLVQRQENLFTESLLAESLKRIDKYRESLTTGEGEVSGVLASLVSYYKFAPVAVVAPLASILSVEDGVIAEIVSLHESLLGEEYEAPVLSTENVKERINEQEWEVDFAKLAAYGGATKSAEESISKFKQVPTDELPEVDTEELVGAHLDSLKLDKVKAETLALAAQARLKDMTLLSESVRIYNEVQEAKQAEFERAKEETLNACES